MISIHVLLLLSSAFAGKSDFTTCTEEYICLHQGRRFTQVGKAARSKDLGGRQISQPTHEVSLIPHNGWSGVSMFALQAEMGKPVITTGSDG